MNLCGLLKTKHGEAKGWVLWETAITSLDVLTTSINRAFKLEKRLSGVAQIPSVNIPGQPWSKLQICWRGMAYGMDFYFLKNKHKTSVTCMGEIRLTCWWAPKHSTTLTSMHSPNTRMSNAVYNHWPCWMGSTGVGSPNLDHHMFPTTDLEVGEGIGEWWISGDKVLLEVLVKWG